MKMALGLWLSAAAFAATMIPASTPAAPGDLYVVEYISNTVFKFTRGGSKSTFTSNLFQPESLGFDHRGNLFVADLENCFPTPDGNCIPPSRIFRFSPSGDQTLFASVASGLFGLAFDSSDNLFVATGQAIIKITPSGIQSTFASGLDKVSSLAFDRLGNLYAAVNGSGSILKFAPNGSRSTFASLPTGTRFPALAFDATGNLFVATGSQIMKITPSGSKSTFASGDFEEYALAFDEQGNLFAGVEDADNTSEPAIVKFSPTGTRTTFAFGPLAPYALAFEPVTEQLRNISARGVVQTGDNVLIAGFIVGGNALANNGVIVRAIGPSLASSGIANSLPDPTLELHNSSGALIASNNNWQETQQAQITATGLAPRNPREAAIYAALPAGAYTAIVRGNNATSGIAVVEVYNLAN
jgi:hypothetical protein